MRTRTRLAALCQAHGIQLLFAFGSRAREALELVDGLRSALTNTGADLDMGAKLYILRRAGDLAPLERERLSLLEKR